MIAEVLRSEMSLLGWSELMSNRQPKTPYLRNSVPLVAVISLFALQGITIALWCKPALIPLVVGTTLLLVSSCTRRMAIHTFLITLGFWIAAFIVLRRDQINMDLPTSWEPIGPASGISSFATAIFESLYLWKSHTRLALFGLTSCVVFFSAWFILV